MFIKKLIEIYEFLSLSSKFENWPGYEGFLFRFLRDNSPVVQCSKFHPPPLKRKMGSPAFPQWNFGCKCKQISRVNSIPLHFFPHFSPKMDIIFWHTKQFSCWVIFAQISWTVLVMGQENELSLEKMLQKNPWNVLACYLVTQFIVVFSK